MTPTRLRGLIQKYGDFGVLVGMNEERTRPAHHGRASARPSTRYRPNGVVACLEQAGGQDY